MRLLGRRRFRADPLPPLTPAAEGGVGRIRFDTHFKVGGAQGVYAVEPEPAEPEPEGDVRADILRVAKTHQPDEAAYGDTYWHAETKSVFWVSWDGTSNDEMEEAEYDFLAIDGVDSFDSEAEAAAPTDPGWERIYPDPS